MPDFESFVAKYPEAFQQARAQNIASGADGITIPPVPDDGISIPKVGTATKAPSMAELFQLFEKHMTGGDTPIAKPPASVTFPDGDTAIEPYTYKGEAIPPEGASKEVGARKNGPTIDGNVAAGPNNSLNDAREVAKGNIGKGLGLLKYLSPTGAALGGLGLPGKAVGGNEDAEIASSNKEFRANRDAAAAKNAPITARIEAKEDNQAPSAAPPVKKISTSSPKGNDFHEAFKTARNSGKKAFSYQGKSYSTQLASEVKQKAVDKVTPKRDVGKSDSTSYLNDKVAAKYRNDPDFTALSPAQQAAKLRG